MNSFTFPENIREREYKVFPDFLEDNDEILYHGTSSEAFDLILKFGFKPARDLPSVSFARDSSLALGYACDHPERVVIAVRFDSPSGLRHENSIVYLDNIANQPLLIGVCVIPSSYRHI